MHIEIRIERPLAVLAVTVATVWGLQTLMDAAVTTADVASPVGGSGESGVATELRAEQDIRELREEQAVLRQREEILRAQLSALEGERLGEQEDPSLAQHIRETTLTLIALLQDQRAADQALLASLRELWDVRDAARTASFASGIAPQLSWPVAPALGISARFHDASYKARFGMEHNAVDIPVEQGSVVYSAADGVVRTVADRGTGFNALVIEHAGGLSTLYGHVSAFLVKEGDRVKAGEAVALSGGRPGSPGAGMFTTGPHLHFEVHHDGEAVDPMGYLQGVEAP